MQEHPKVTTLESLNDFFKVEEIKDHVANEHLRMYFEGKGFSDLLTTHLRTQNDLLSEIYIPDGAVENTEIIGIQVTNSEINYPRSENIKDLRIDNFYAISNRHFTADVSLTTTAQVNFVSYYGHYVDLQREDSRDITMDSMNNVGMCDLCEIYFANFTGRIEITFAQDFNLETVSKLAQELQKDKEALKVGLEIDSATLIRPA